MRYGIEKQNHHGEMRLALTDRHHGLRANTFDGYAIMTFEMDQLPLAEYVRALLEANPIEVS